MTSGKLLQLVLTITQDFSCVMTCGIFCGKAEAGGCPLIPCLNHGRSGNAVEGHVDFDG
jgi:hypothetical protein